VIEFLEFEEPDHIIDHIYLGPNYSAKDLDYLKKQNIKRILVCGI
jgi:hypothetical protein